MNSMNSAKYKFTNTWFDNSARSNWEHIIPQLRPNRVLEIGSYEGASACWLIEALGRLGLDLICIDTWSGGAEHANVDMLAVEMRFISNVRAASEGMDKVRVTRMKERSETALARLICEDPRPLFDFIYVDGSHQSQDVLSDAVLAFKLLRPGGVMAFDDYLWTDGSASGENPIQSPKLAIDAFTNIYGNQLKILSLPLYQVYVQKR